VSKVSLITQASAATIALRP